MRPLPVVLDTDIGDDIDDALAFAVILNSSELELRGITTVFRDAPRRALLAKQLLGIWNRADIPVCAGVSKPLLEPFAPQLGSQFEILEADTVEQSNGHAVDFLIEAAGTVEAVQAPLTIAPIGPLTNIALAIAREPRIIENSRLVLMGGMWNSDAPDYKAEWNILCDPEAAAMVFESGIQISMIGLDVTTQCVLEQKHLQKIAAHNSPGGALLHRLIELWMRESKRPPTLHDPLAILTLFDDCVKFEEKKIEVQLCGEKRGQTRVVSGAANARVAVEVNAPHAIELFMERILAL